MQATYHHFERRGWVLPFQIFPWWIWAGGIMGTVLVWFVNNTPDVARIQTLLAMLMLLTDSVTGVIAAGLEQRISSRRMRTRFIAKVAQYTGLVVLTAAPSMLLKNWLPVEGGLTAILMFEGISILENMYRLELVGGINLGPAKPLINFISKYLDIPQDRPAPPVSLVITPDEAKKDKPLP